MASVREHLARVAQLPGVRAVVLAGREGLPIEVAGRGDTRLFETLAALGASAFSTGEALGQELMAGGMAATVYEYQHALVSIDPLGEYAVVVTLAENAGSLARIRQMVQASRDEVLRALDTL